MARARRWLAAAAAALLGLGAPAAAIAAPATPPTAAVVIGDEHFQTVVADAKAAMLSDPVQAIATAETAETYAARSTDPQQRALMRATALWLQGEARIRLSDTALAAPLIDKALAIVAARMPGSKLHGDVLLSAGGIATEEVRVAQALSDYQNAHAIFRRLGDTRSEAKALIQIASLYAAGNDHANALKYLGQALDVHRVDPGLSVAILNGRGNALKDLGRYEEADEQFGEALELARQMKSPLIEAMVLGNLARARLDAGRVGAAQAPIAEGLRIASDGDAAAVRPRLQALAAQEALQQHALPTARRLIAESFAGRDLETTTLADRDAHETAYRIYAATGEDGLALAHLAAVRRIDDEATKLARSTTAALMAARFDFANQELRYQTLKNDELRRSVAFEQARARTQQYVFLGGTGAAGIIVGVLVFALVTVRRSRNDVSAANDDLAVTNEALGKALAAKTEFLATTSHEIRTPLNGILGMTQVMLADTAITGATRDRLRVVEGAGATMRALVDDILDVAKMETGNLTIETAPFDLRQTVLDSTRLWEDQAAAKGIAFVRELADCPTMVEGDAARLRQIVFNLVSNALKFTESGNVTLRIGAPAPGQVRIAVVDTGIGIPAGKREEIFESFRQADTSTTRRFGGTGLGLSICRNIARAMGGDVTVDSVEGRGSTFTVDLPLAVVEPTIGVDAAAPTAGTIALVVDRNPITRSMVRTLLAPHVDEARGIASIAEAVEACRDTRFAQIVVDEATARAEADLGASLAALAGAAGGASVSLLWPGDDGESHVKLLESGIDRVVSKPISGAALVAALFSSIHANLGDRRLVSQAA